MPITRSEPATTEVADEVDRRDRRTTGRADVREHAGQRDVVDVVADLVRERAVLAPPGHAPVDEPRVARSARRPDRCPGARRPRAGSPRSGRRPTRTSASTTSAPRRVLEVDPVPSAGRGRAPSTGDAGDHAAPRGDRRRRGRAGALRRPGRRATMPANCIGPMLGISSTRYPVSGPLMSPELEDAGRVLVEELRPDVVTERDVRQLREDAVVGRARRGSSPLQMILSAPRVFAKWMISLG